MQVCFDLPYLYYLPQYAPVILELLRRGVDCRVVGYRSGNEGPIEAAVNELGLDLDWVENEPAAHAEYKRSGPDWLVCGNSFPGIPDLHPSTRTALLFHGSGTGVKVASLTPTLGAFHVRFVSGPGRMPIFRELYPDTDLCEVGFAKLDPLCTPEGVREARMDLEALGLDPSKPTLLYAPTFYPSSIENMSKRFPQDASDFNVLVKAHDFSLNKPRYKHQRARLESYAKASNVYLARDTEYSLVPFLATADVMATDTSSSIFECASIDKPVLTCDFVRLRWNYRGPWRYRLRRRLDPSTKHYLDVAEGVKRYRDLLPRARAHVQNPGLLRETRMHYANELMGPLDGKASVRIANYFQGLDLHAPAPA